MQSEEVSSLQTSIRSVNSKDRHAAYQQLYNAFKEKRFGTFLPIIKAEWSELMTKLLEDAAPREKENQNEETIDVTITTRQMALRCLGVLSHLQSVGTCFTNDDVRLFVECLMLNCRSSSDKMSALVALWCLTTHRLPAAMLQPHLSSILHSTLRASQLFPTSAILIEILSSWHNLLQSQREQMVDLAQTWLPIAMQWSAHHVLRISEKAVLLLEGIPKSSQALVFSHFQSTLLPLMQDRLHSYPLIVIKLLSWTFSALGSRILRSPTLIQMLQLFETIFNRQEKETTLPALIAWQNVLVTYKQHSVNLVPKRIQMLMAPILSVAAYEDDDTLRRVAMETWWVLVVALDDWTLFFDTIIAPLQFWMNADQINLCLVFIKVWTTESDRGNLPFDWRQRVLDVQFMASLDSSYHARLVQTVMPWWTDAIMKLDWDLELFQTSDYFHLYVYLIRLLAKQIQTHDVSSAIQTWTLQILRLMQSKYVLATECIHTAMDILTPRILHNQLYRFDGTTPLMSLLQSYFSFKYSDLRLFCVLVNGMKYGQDYFECLASVIHQLSSCSCPLQHWQGTASEVRLFVEETETWGPSVGSAEGHEDYNIVFSLLCFPLKIDSQTLLSLPYVETWQYLWQTINVTVLKVTKSTDAPVEPFIRYIQEKQYTNGPIMLQIANILLRSLHGTPKTVGSVLLSLKRHWPVLFALHQWTFSCLMYDAESPAWLECCQALELSVQSQPPCIALAALCDAREKLISLVQHEAIPLLIMNWLTLCLNEPQICNQELFDKLSSFLEFMLTTDSVSCTKVAAQFCQLHCDKLNRLLTKLLSRSTVKSALLSPTAPVPASPCFTSPPNSANGILRKRPFAVLGDTPVSRKTRRVQFKEQIDCHQGSSSSASEDEKRPPLNRCLAKDLTSMTDETKEQDMKEIESKKHNQDVGNVNQSGADVGTESKSIFNWIKEWILLSVIAPIEIKSNEYNRMEIETEKNDEQETLMAKDAYQQDTLVIDNQNIQQDTLAIEKEAYQDILAIEKETCEQAIDQDNVEQATMEAEKDSSVQETLVIENHMDQDTLLEKDAYKQETLVIEDNIEQGTLAIENDNEQETLLGKDTIEQDTLVIVHDDETLLPNHLLQQPFQDSNLSHDVVDGTPLTTPLEELLEKWDHDCTVSPALTDAFALDSKIPHVSLPSPCLDESLLLSQMQMLIERKHSISEHLMMNWHQVAVGLLQRIGEKCFFKNS